MHTNPTHKSLEGKNAAGLTVKTIKRTLADEKESLVRVETFREAARSSSKSIDVIHQTPTTSIINYQEDLVDENVFRTTTI